jgi:hypothetical protein
MRALALGVLVGLSALVAAGCSGEDPTQRAVREQVDARAAALGGYPGERSHCTRTPRPWLVPQATSVYLCAVPRGDGDCDLFTAQVDDLGVKVALTDERAGCVLPV